MHLEDVEADQWFRHRATKTLAPSSSYQLCLSASRPIIDVHLVPSHFSVMAIPTLVLRPSNRIPCGLEF